MLMLTLSLFKHSPALLPAEHKCRKHKPCQSGVSADCREVALGLVVSDGSPTCVAWRETKRMVVIFIKSLSLGSSAFKSFSCFLQDPWPLAERLWLKRRSRGQTAGSASAFWVWHSSTLI